MKIPAIKLRGESGRWERPQTCCLVDLMADSSTGEDNRYDTHMEVGPEQGTEELHVSDCHDQPDHELSEYDADEPVHQCDNELVIGGCSGNDDDDYRNEEATGSSNMEVDEQPQPPTESPTETDSNTSGERLQTECETVKNHNEIMGHLLQDNKRNRGEKDQSSPSQPPTKQQKSDTLLSKTAKVLGTCEEVRKFEKLKQNVKKSPKSRYHIERYEAHLVKVQIIMLKDIQEMIQ